MRDSYARLSERGFCVMNMLSDEMISRISSFFKVLGDETRVKILYALSQREMCVSDISEALEISQSASRYRSVFAT